MNAHLANAIDLGYRAEALCSAIDDLYTDGLEDRLQNLLLMLFDIIMELKDELDALCDDADVVDVIAAVNRIG